MSLLMKMSKANRGLRYKLMIAFSLMTIIPLLALVYVISTYLFPQLENVADVSTVVITCLVVAVLGLVMAKGLIDPVIDMAIEAKIIASGDYDRRISVSSEDEVGNLGQSINSMTQKIRTNIEELKNYGQRMRDINVEIHKKVLALSSLLQIGDIIAKGDIQIDSLLEFAVEKAAQVFDAGFGILFLPLKDEAEAVPRTHYNVEGEKILELVVRRGGRGFLDKAIDGHDLVVLDKGSKGSSESEELKKDYNIKNLVAVPISTGKNGRGLLVVGTKLENVKFKSDDADLIKVFAKQITIAIESDVLNKRAEELAIKDDLTGLYNKNFILSSLEEEIKRAIFYQRPCSFVVFNIDNFKKFRDGRGELLAEEALKRLAKIMKENMIPVGKIARIGGDEFAIILPEKNKKEAAYLAEDMRKRIGSTNLIKEGDAMLTVSCGVSENPIDGTTADQLFKRAVDAVAQAKSAGKNMVMS